MAFDKPQSRNEAILQNMLGADNVLEPPQSRIESLLQEILEAGGGGGGTDDYNDLKNQPQIGGNTLTGNKSASDLGLVAAETGKGLSTNDYTNADKAIVGGVTAALEGKQDALTAGDYIDITNNEISVNRNIIPDNTTYNIEHVSRFNAVVTKYINGVKQSENNYTYWGGTVWTIDDAFKLVCDRDNNAFAYQLLADTIDHMAGYYGILFDTNETSVGVEVDLIFPEEDTSGQKLVIKSEMDTAIATKADLTDLAPAFSASTAYTVGQYVSYDGNIYKCTSAHSAGAWVAGDFTLVAVGSELESKQDATDNNLQTTAKGIVPAINELNSNLSSLGLSVVNGKICQTYSV